MKAFYFLISFVSASWLGSCSLSSYPTPFIFKVRLDEKALSEGGRDQRGGPDLTAMDSYAISFALAGGADSVRTADVGGRSLNCLGLKGTIVFPVTFAQLRSGVAVGLTAGDYDITILGFSGSTTSANIESLYSTSPNLSAYRLAQRSASLVPGSSVVLPASYSPASSPDLNQYCPGSLAAMHAMFFDTAPRYLTNKSGAWLQTKMEPVPAATGDFSLDSNGAVHATYALGIGAGYGVRYANNVGGFFSSRLVASFNETGVLERNAIIVEPDGTKRVFAPNLGVGLIGVKEYTGGLNGFFPQTTVVAENTSFAEIVAEQSIEGKRVVGSIREIDKSRLTISVFGASAWETVANLTSDGTNVCATISSHRLFFDKKGYLHAIYYCQNGFGGLSTGYATNRSGTWVSSRFCSTSFSTASVLAGAVDGDDRFHGLCQTSPYGMEYVSGSLAGGSFAASGSFMNNGVGDLNSAVLLAYDANRIRVLTGDSAGDLALWSRNSGSGAFTKEIILQGAVRVLVPRGYLR